LGEVGLAGMIDDDDEVAVEFVADDGGELIVFSSNSANLEEYW
jgi:hypothetical protein